MKWMLVSSERKYTLQNGLTLIGKSKLNDVFLPGLKSIHACIYIRRNILEIQAKGDVYVNNFKVQRIHNLFWGDKIVFRNQKYKTTFYLEIENASINNNNNNTKQATTMDTNDSESENSMIIDLTADD